ncbi:MAG: hypothetical protein Q8R82_21280 [Hyphomonadaceae bacterium]|nr:hypothetical protein [Hyphomonadaceae bacterium]
MKFVIISGGVATLAALGAGYAYLIKKTPEFNQVVHPCVLAEASQPPARRLSTCICLFEEL